MLFRNELPDVLNLPPFSILTVQRQIRKNGLPIKLQPRIYNFLEFLLAHANQELSPEAIEPLSATNDSETAARQCYKDLRDAVGEEIDKYLVRTRARKPEPSKYRFICRELLPKPHYVFPRARQPHSENLSSSWLGADLAGNDWVDGILAPDKFQGRETLTVKVNQSGNLVIPFRHRGKKVGCWWSAVIPLDIASNREWKPVDLARYNKLLFESRAFLNDPTEDVRIVIPLRVRLEDASWVSLHKSQHQATSWVTPDPLTRVFRTIKISLREFDWSRTAWPKENTEPVDKRSVFQIVFGQDHTIDEHSGSIELRNIRFEI